MVIEIKKRQEAITPAWELPEGLKPLIGFFGNGHTFKPEFPNSSWIFAIGTSTLEVEKINDRIWEVKMEIGPNEKMGKRSACAVFTDEVCIINNNPSFGEPTIKLEDDRQIAIVSKRKFEDKDDLSAYFETKGSVSVN